jgi:hypothetical protein
VTPEVGGGETAMSDLGSGIAGSFNQSLQASRAVEADRQRVHQTDGERVRDARQRFIAAREEVEQAQTLGGTRVEGDKEESAGGDARDQYELHEEFDQRHLGTPTRKGPRQRRETDERKEGSGDGSGSGHLVDIEA